MVELHGTVSARGGDAVIQRTNAPVDGAEEDTTVRGRFAESGFG